MSNTDPICEPSFVPYALASTSTSYSYYADVIGFDPNTWTAIGIDGDYDAVVDCTVKKDNKTVAADSYQMPYRCEVVDGNCSVVIAQEKATGRKGTPSPPGVGFCISGTDAGKENPFQVAFLCGNYVRRCKADYMTDEYRTSLGDSVCCGQEGTLHAGDAKYICPKELQYCNGYGGTDDTLGTCKETPPTQTGGGFPPFFP